MRPVCILLVLSLATAVPARGLAQAPATQTVAYRQFQEAREAMKGRDFKKALELLRASHESEPGVGKLLNIAECEKELGLYASALRHYKEALPQLKGDERLSQAQERHDQVMPHIRVSLAAGAPPGTKVTLDGEPIAPASLGVDMPIEPGRHVVVATAPGRVARTKDVVLIEGKTKELAMEPGAANEALRADAPTHEPPASAEPVPRDTAVPPAEGPSPGPWIVGGIGVAGLVVGIAAGAVVLQNKSVVDAHCTNGPPPTCRDTAGLDAASAVRTLGPVTTVGLVVGAAGIATGAIWLGIQRSDTSSARFGVGPTVGGATLRSEWSW